MIISSAETSRGYTLKLEMTETTSVAANTSTISWALVLYSKGYNFGSFGAGWSVYINGTRVGYHDRNTSDRYSIDKNSSWTIQSGTTTVEHDNDGTKTISCSASLDMAGNPGPGPMSLSGSWQLTNIPRASSLTVPTLNIGQAVNFTITRAVDTFTHTLAYSFAGQTGVIGTGLTTSASWTIPESFLDLLPNAAAGPGTLTLTTYNGTTLIGSKVYDVSFVVPASYVPVLSGISLTQQSANTWLSNKSFYVSGYSRVRVAATVTAPRGATATLQISGDAGSGTGSPWTSGILSGAGTKTITLTAVDSRGRTATATRTITVLAYTQAGISSLTYERGTLTGSTWEADVQGNHIKVTAAAAISLTAQNNSATIVVACTGQTSQTISGTSGVVYFTGTSSEQVYTVTATVTDSIGTSGSVSVVVPTAEVPFFWNAKQIGLGKIATRDGYIEIGYAMDFAGVDIPDPNEAGKYLAMNDAGTGLEWKAGSGGGAPTDSPAFTGTPTAPTAPTGTDTTQLATTEFVNNSIEAQADRVVEQGTSGIWTYRKWDSGIAECWGVSAQSFTGWQAWDGLYEGTPRFREAYPSGLFTSVPVLTVTPYGDGNMGLCGVEVYTGHTASYTPFMYPLRPSAGSSATVYFYLHAIGRWK